MICLLFNNTSCSPKQKSTIVLLYKSIFRLKSLSFRRLYVKFRLTFTNHATIRRYITDYVTLIEATSPSIRH